MSDKSNPALLAELTASRLAHEVVGPIGAIANGLELMEELGDAAGDDAMGLVSTSVREAGARLRFFRMAYGRSGYGVTDMAQLRAASSEFLDDSRRHDLAWPMPPILPSLPEGAGRLALLLIELARDALPRGGLIHVTASGDAIEVAARGQPAGLSLDLVQAVSGRIPEDGLSPRTVHGALAAAFAEEIGWSVKISEEEASVVLRVFAIQT